MFFPSFLLKIFDSKKLTENICHNTRTLIEKIYSSNNELLLLFYVFKSFIQLGFRELPKQNQDVLNT